MTPPEERAGIDSVVITTDEGDPVVVAINIEGMVCVATLNDSNFAEYMKQLGYDPAKLPKASVVKV
jgi:hypothetical protein